MAKKKKIKRFSKVQAVKEMARERVGILPKPQVVPNRKKARPEQAKYKPKLEDMLRDPEA